MYIKMRLACASPASKLRKTLTHQFTWQRMAAPVGYVLCLDMSVFSAPALHAQTRTLSATSPKPDVTACLVPWNGSGGGTGSGTSSPTT
ncbi:MAG TPA: hypothetical protein VFN53_08430, partial [Acidobacteriaceae bacterium]|nr:hypothetical protein [Acidobacteriaceae bacterium]